MVSRPQIFWYGKPHTIGDLTEAQNRGIVIKAVRTGEIPDYSYARAVVFWATSPHFDSALSDLDSQAIPAVNNGLFIYVVVETAGQLNEVARVLKHLLPGDDRHYKIRTIPTGTEMPPFEIPQHALMHDAGPIANSALIINLPSEVEISAGRRLMLQRAFQDCKSIKLELITGGLSGAQTFYVKATLASSNAGSTPVPFFAKQHQPRKLRSEMESFRMFAEHHVSWYLRPNFLQERCLYGVDDGVLVGSFVEDSRSLWDLAVEGHGPQHIRTLFNETLAVLRQSKEIADPADHPSVVEPLEEFCPHARISPDRVRRATHFGGELGGSALLWRKLLNLPKNPWYRSSIHGDLHANNVRVRKTDVIVIDFAHATKGPMCADLAALEMWLNFEWPEGKAFDPEPWRLRTEFLYRPSTLLRLVDEGDAELSTDWSLPCIFEIRRLAKESTLSPEEYARVIAVYLLRMATFSTCGDGAENAEFRRDYAYWLANRLVEALCEVKQVNLEAA